MHKYKVGEVLVIHSITYAPHDKYNGLQITVTGTYMFAEQPSYYIDLVSEGISNWSVWEKNLKRPDQKPEEEPSRGDMDLPISWDDMPWNPNKEPTKIKTKEIEYV